MNNKVKIPPHINPKNVRNEADSRKNILADAKVFGCLPEVIKCFERYDRMLANCKNESERKDISIMGSAEIYRIMGLKGGLSVDGKDIIPSDDEIKEKETAKNKA